MTAFTNYRDTIALGFSPDLAAYSLADRYPLDEVIDDQKNTILHVIVDTFAVDPVELDRILSKKTFTTLEPRNQGGKTPLQISIEKGQILYSRILTAHRESSSHCQDIQNILKVVQVLNGPVRNGAMLEAMLKCFTDGTSLKDSLDNAHNTLPYLLLSKGYSSFLVDILLRNDKSIVLEETLSPATSSIYSELVAAIDQRILKYPSEDKTDTIFHSFVKYSSQSSWKYQASNVTYNHGLLKEPAKREYGVNCIGLSHALRTIFIAYGIFDMQCDGFDVPENQCIKMRTPEQVSTPVIGKYRCFDRSNNDKIFLFSRHCVVRRNDNDLCYDPTFSCAYLKKDAPIDYIQSPKQ